MTMASINKETRETESKTDKDEKETTKQRNNETTKKGVPILINQSQVYDLKYTS